jgi:hypothetical protein
MSERRTGPEIGSMTDPAVNADRAKLRGVVDLTWGARDDGPDEKFAFLYFNRSDGKQQFLRCSQEELDDLISELKTVRSWLGGNNYAGLMRGEKKKKCKTCKGTGKMKGKIEFRDTHEGGSWTVEHECPDCRKD